jgi:hypothetical protein
MLRAYDFKCPKGHTTEHFLSAFAEAVVCGENGCEERSAYSPSFWYSSSARNAQGFTPVVIHKDSQGNVRFPANANAPVPPGFQKVELTNIQQVRRLEKEVNTKDREIAEKFRQSRQVFLDGQLKENRRVMEDIRNGGSWIGTDPAGRPVIRHGLSNKGQKFLDAMRQQSELRQKQGSRHTNPEFVVDAFSYNQSNRDPYYNEHGGSHRR